MYELYAIDLAQLTIGNSDFFTFDFVKWIYYIIVTPKHELQLFSDLVVLVL